MRLIDADAFKEYIRNSCEELKFMFPDGGKLAGRLTEEFCKDIDEQPTIDTSNTSNTLGALDCVDRQKAIDALKICDNNEDGINCHKCPLRDERWDGAWQDNETNCYRKLMRDSAKLLELPSVQPRKGKWLKAGTRMGIPLFECSLCECGEEVPTVMGKPSYNFCPNCGCRMEEGDSDDN